MMVRVLLQPPVRRLKRRRRRGSDWLRLFLLAVAVVALGITGYVYLDANLYQAYENWKFDHEAITRPPVRPAEPPAVGTPAPEPRPKPVIPRDALLGRIEIPRLGLHVMVREGVDTTTLRRAVGHVPGTATPGEDGNVAVAAHRDTFFRPLKDIRPDDHIFMETPDSRYEYVVESTKIVSPNDVSVLRPTKDPELTLITCYPFYYVGNAPRRFIVRARQVSVEARDAPLNPGHSGS